MRVGISGWGWHSMAMSRRLTGCLILGLGSFFATADAQVGAEAPDTLILKPIGRFDTGLFGQSASEIPAYCELSRRLFVVNAAAGQVDVLDLKDPSAPRRVGQLKIGVDTGQVSGAVNCVSIHDGVVAVAVDARPATDPGRVAFYRTDSLALVGSVTVGAGPDMLTFSPDGQSVLVANEGEPNSDYTCDPEGSVSIIDVSAGFDKAEVRTITFRDWNPGGTRAGELPDLMRRGLRHFGQVRPLGQAAPRPSTLAEDVEPEWVAISADGRSAYVGLQEANTVAVLDLASGTVARLMPLGFKDYGLSGNEIDVSDRDGGIRLRCWPGLYGVFMPDAIRLHVVDGRTYVVTANEGDSRVRGGVFSDEARLKNWNLKGTPFAALAESADLGRLELVRDLVERHLDDAGRPTRLFTFGGRSFSIFDAATGERIFDSGNDFERLTAARVPWIFNASHQAPDADVRSRSKGPEPEGLVLGKIGPRVYAFVGLERVGGIMMYDISDPRLVRFAGYHNDRSPAAGAQGVDPEAGDLGPEGIIFIPAEKSPNGRDLLVVCYEVSGSTVIYEVVERGLAPVGERHP